MLKQKEWIDLLVEKTGVSKKDAKVFYDCVFDYIREQITVEEPIKIPGFGVFKLRQTAAKVQVNLVTGQPEEVPAHNVITFKPYFELEPKPEAIEVEFEEGAEVDVAVVNAETEEVEEVVEEPTPVEEVVEEAPVEACEEVVEEEPDHLVWLFEDQRYTTGQIVEVLKSRVNISDVEVDQAIDVVKAKMKDLNKNVCKVNEKDDSFEVVIAKEQEENND